MNAPSREQPSQTLAVCLSARTGLGHLRRVTNIIAALKRFAPACRVIVVSNAPIAGLSSEEAALFDIVHLAEREDMARCLIDLGADAVAVDTAIVPNLELLPQPLALILRETVPDRIPAFQLPGRRLWDEVIIASPESDWTVSPHEIGARRVHNVGWIYRRASGATRVLGGRNKNPVLLIATGGGGSAVGAAQLASEIGPIVAATRRGLQEPVRVVQVVGPRAPKDAIVANVDEVLDVGSALDEAFMEADAVISTAGYNSILELATTGTPALLCSIPRTFDDQAARIRVWAPMLGMSHSAGNPDRSGRWLAETLKVRARRPAVDLGPSGGDRAAQVLVDLLACSDRPDGSRHFIKGRSGAGLLPSQAVSERSVKLFASRVPTPPAMCLQNGGGLAFAKLDGPTAFDLWTEVAARDVAVESIPHELCAAVLQPLVRLNQVDLRKLPLRSFDPWQKITPRLASGAQAATRMDQACLFRLKQALEVARTVDRKVSRGAGSPPIGIVHGDFHLRQLIRPHGRPDFLLVDLDDLARGHAEADIGNCAANIATNFLPRRELLTAKVVALLSMLASTYAKLAGRRLNSLALGHYAALALVRRALKFSEGGRSANDIAAIVDAVALIAHLSSQDRDPFSQHDGLGSMPA